MYGLNVEDPTLSIVPVSGVKTGEDGTGDETGGGVRIGLDDGSPSRQIPPSGPTPDTLGVVHVLFLRNTESGSLILYV